MDPSKIYFLLKISLDAKLVPAMPVCTPEKWHSRPQQILGFCNFSRSSCSGVIHEIAERLQFIQSGQLTIVAQIGGPLFVSESLSSAIELHPAIAAVKRLLVLWAPLRFLVWWSVVYLEPNIPTAFYSSYIGSGAILPGPSSFSIGTG